MIGEGDAPWCVQLDVAPDEVDEASGALWTADVSSVQEIDLADGRRRLVAGTTETGAAALVARLAPRWRADTYPADYDGWLDAWRPFAQAVRVDGLLVHPAWDAVEPEPGVRPVSIDAQRAFGQGNHPTTRLVLAELQRQPLGERVLDVGCGSGVLSVAAALLGVSRVTAVDIDPAAVAATAANAERNGVTRAVDVSTTPVEEVTGRFDLVLANILAPVLVALAPAIAERATDEGTIIVSGLLAEQRDEVLAAYPDHEVVAERILDGWLALTLRRTVRGNDAEPRANR